MKTSKFFFIIGLFLASFQLNAQIEKEINTYVDSTEILLTNGRKMLLEEIQLFNYPKATEIFYFLQSKAEQKQCNVFNYTEELYISMLISNWDYFFQKAENIKIERNSYCYFFRDNVERDLYSEVIKNSDRIEAQIHEGNFSPEQKELFEIYFYVLKLGTQDEWYNNQLKNFKKKYPQTQYKDFINIYLPKPIVKGGLSFSFGATGFFPQGNLQGNFDASVGGAMSFDFNINKLYFSFFLDGGTQKLKTPFNVVKDSFLYNFKSGDKFSNFNAGLEGGYFVFRGKHVHVVPYLTIGGGSLESNLFEGNTPDDKEYEIYNSFIYGGGLHTEFKIIDLNDDFANGYLSLKLDGGYNVITHYNYVPFKGNVMYLKLSLNLGLGIF
jgi:hypothetical protein